MTRYSVQFEMPVDNPLNNVRRAQKKWGVMFYVPINHPDIDRMGYTQLCEAAQARELLVISTPLNKTGS